jgi:methoxymalonate biosynthesis protein
MTTDVVAVVGVGVIGSGVASRALQAGLPVVAVDLNEETLVRAEQRIRADRRLLRMQGRDRIAKPLAAPLPDLTLTTDLARIGSAGLIIENTSEAVEAKQAVLAAITTLADPVAVVATNTSGIPIGELAAATHHPARVIGAHFMNPAAFIDAVEVIPSPHTSSATREQLLTWLARMGARGIVVGDAPGFVCNRILMLAVNEAAALVGEGVAEPAAVDEIFTSCLGHRMGPLRTADLIGLDTVVASLQVLAARLGPRFEPAAPLLALVAAGRCGRKNGAGFFGYPEAR